MDGIIKTILGVVISVVIIYTGLGFLWANNEAVAAEAYLHKVGNEISASNLNEDVVKECQTQATENGYTLIYEIIKDANGVALYVNLELQYTYSVTFVKLAGVHSHYMSVF